MAEIVLTPEMLIAQATQMQTLAGEFESLFSQTTNVLHGMNDSWSENIATNFVSKILLAQQSFSSITNMLSKQLADFIRRHLDFFTNYNAIKLYYDNGQTEVTKILVSVFNTLLDNVEFKRVIPSNYRLFQVADLMCTLKLTELKMNKHILSRSEIYFFKDERTFKKNYIKPIERKIF